MTPPLSRTPLYAWHIDAEARIVPFAGFEMPLVYTSILDEHRHVRTQAGLFDVSHMGEFRLRGPDAARLAQRLFSNRVSDLAPGQVRYGVFCTPEAGVIDDATLYCESETEYLFCVNAATAADDFAWFQQVHSELGADCELIDESPATALIAVQGPRARAITHKTLGESCPKPRRWHFAKTRFESVEVVLSRTGYTGEDGYEIYLPALHASALWCALLETGAGAARPIGLAARDTLRTEMAYSLYGHELDREINPLEADLERFVAFGSGFIGEPALETIRRAGPARRRVGLVVAGRQVARPGTVIASGEPIGHVTSGTFGPSIERSIAIGYVPAHYAAPGTQLAVEIRGRRIPCEVTETPFYSRKS